MIILNPFHDTPERITPTFENITAICYMNAFPMNAPWSMIL